MAFLLNIMHTPTKRLRNIHEKGTHAYLVFGTRSTHSTHMRLTL